MFWELKRTVSLRRFFEYSQLMFWLGNKDFLYLHFKPEACIRNATEGTDKDWVEPLSCQYFLFSEYVVCLLHLISVPYYSNALKTTFIIEANTMNHNGQLIRAV